MNRTDLNINIGCGPTGQIEGFNNLDNSPSALIGKYPLLKKFLFTFGVITEAQYRADWSKVIWCDASKRLPYESSTVHRIYSSHFLEHIPLEKAKKVLMECFRVLRPDGVLRLVIPDLLWHAERYVSKTKYLLAHSELPGETEAHDVFLNTVYGAYLQKKRSGAEHCYMYDLPSIVSLMKKAGFNKISSCEYKQGIDMILASYDSRPDESLFLEAKK